MNNTKSPFLERFKKYHFELKHLLVLFIILIFFLILVSFVHKTSLQGLLINTQDWYQQDSAERLANLTATSIELLLETSGKQQETDPLEVQKIVQAFNIILSQQQLQQNVDEIVILVSNGDKTFAIDNGRDLYNHFFGGQNEFPPLRENHQKAIEYYEKGVKEKIIATEQIHSIREDDQIFHVFVPFVPKGEYVGAVYVKNQPDFSFITQKIISSFDETALIFAALIILGLLAMFYISSHTVKERDEAQQLFFKEHEKYLLAKIDREKEALFTKRIYHTHHKAEKIMGFIKEDLRNLSENNIEETKFRTTRYANFISRVIYDMKWYDPPLQAIRNPAFRTDLNKVLQFIVQYIFLRTSDRVTHQFKMDLDENLPAVPINEFVVWEIFEPLIQNCVEHSGATDITVSIQTCHDKEGGSLWVRIGDNGKGFDPQLLEENGRGKKKLFLENISSKKGAGNSGYGCYIAHEIAKRRCGWEIDAENLQEGGCRYIIKIPYRN